MRENKQILKEPGSQAPVADASDPCNLGGRDEKEAILGK
jgi:hypothetical protein